MGQTLLFILFIIALMVGTFVHFSPKQQGIRPLSLMADKRNDEMTGETITKESKQMNVTTNEGAVQINKQIDDLTREKKALEDVISDEELAVDNVNKEIADISKQADGTSGPDILRLKALGQELQNEKILLVAHGRQLIALNDQLNEKRKSLTRQRDAVNINTDSTLQSLQDRKVSTNDQASVLFDGVKDKNSDAMQHTKDLIDEQRQKAQDRKDR
jgi:hypothetical protein